MSLLALDLCSRNSSSSRHRMKNEPNHEQNKKKFQDGHLGLLFTCDEN